jgi:hypothetical protein
MAKMIWELQKENEYIKRQREILSLVQSSSNCRIPGFC